VRKDDVFGRLFARIYTIGKSCGVLGKSCGVLVKSCGVLVWIVEMLCFSYAVGAGQVSTRLRCQRIRGLPEVWSPGAWISAGSM
jgi:hypothetical protein